MRTLKLAIAASLMLAAAPSLAQTPAAPNDTIQAIIAKGDALDVMGTVYTLTYSADGTYKDDQGSGGKWRADGDKLCINPDAIGQELCSVYPGGKKSGDKFEIQSDFGAMMITIK